MDENIVGDHEVGSSSAVESQQQQSISWSLRNVAILASFCVVAVISFAALSMIAPFYPHEVNIDYFIVGERVRFLFTSCEESQTNERVFQRVSLRFFTTSE